MRRHQWGFVLASVALLLDPTFADVLVASGYDQPTQEAKTPAAPNYLSKSQPVVQPQQTYAGTQENPAKQFLRYQHKIQQQQLQGIHQQERDHLLQLQRQQLQHPAVQQAKIIPRNEVVGTSWGGRTFFHPVSPAMGGFKGGRIFSMGPFGLNTISLRGLGGLTPLLLSPYHPQQMTGSNEKLGKSTGEQTAENRRKRDVAGDGGESAGRKGRQKSSRPQQNIMAENPALSSKYNVNSPMVQPAERTDKIVEGTKNGGEETVGKSNLLDPLGLADKAGNFIDDLRHGHLPNPLDILDGEGSNYGSSRLNQANAGGHQFEEHVVGQPNQYQYQYQYQNQGQPRLQQSQRPWESSNVPPAGRSSWLAQPGLSQAPPYGFYSTPQSAFVGRSNGMVYGDDGVGTAYQEGQWLAPSNPYNQPITATTSRAQPQQSETRTIGWSNNGADQLTGSANPSATSNARPKTGEASPTIGTPSKFSSANQNREQTFGSSFPTSGFAPPQVGKFGQPLMGTLYNPVTGRAIPAAWNGFGNNGGTPVSAAGGRMARNDMVGGPLTNAIYEIGSQFMGYNDDYPYDYNRFDYNAPGRHFKPNFDLDDVFDDGYHNHFYNGGGGYDRYYGTVYDDGFHANRGGYHPFYNRPYRPQIF